MYDDGPDFANAIEAPEQPDVVELNEQTERVNRLMGETLTQPEHEVMLALLDGLSVTELAQIRGTSHQAVSKQRANGLSKLRRALSERP